MAFSKEKAFDRAERYAAKGHHDKAAREYQAIVDHDPKEIRAWLMLADCLVRCGDAQRAIERYLQVGGYYIQQKDHQKALAVYRQVLNLDASRIDVQLRVAALNQELGRTQDAVAMYERVAGLQLQAGNTIDALLTYKVVADADPTAVSRRLRLAELYSREKQVPEAVEAFRVAGAQLLDQERQSDYVRVAERLLYHDASDLPTVRQLAAVYLDLGDPRRALMKLNGLLQADAGDREGIELLAQTFMALGKPDKAVSAIGELARALTEAGSPAERAEAERVLRLGLSWVSRHPGLSAALAKLQGGAAQVTPDAPGPSPKLELVQPPEPVSQELDVVELDDADVELDDADLILEDDAAVALGGPDTAAQAAAVPSTVPPASDRSMTQSVLSEASDDQGGAIDTDSLTDFDKILFEARVYIKYRLFEHALDHVGVALRQQPEHVGALSLMARALAELGRSVEAADAHVRVAGLVLGNDPKLSREHVAAALGLAPGHVEALQVQARGSDEGGAAAVADPVSPPDTLGPPRLLEIDTIDESAANLLPVNHDAGVDEDFSIEVEMVDDASDDAASTAPIVIEDRFGLDPPDDHEAAAPNDSGVTGEFDPPVAEADSELLGPDAAGAFDRLAAEVTEHGEHSLGGVELLEPSLDDSALSLHAHVEPTGGLHPPALEVEPAAEPDLIGLSIGRDEARALEPDVDLTVEAPPPSVVLPEPEPEPEPEPATWPDISDDVAEVRFYLDQGLDEDAEATVEDLRSRYPGHPALAVFDAPEAGEAPAIPAETGASSPLISLEEPTEQDDEDGGGGHDTGADEDEDEDEDDYLAAIFSEPSAAKKSAPAPTGGARVASDDIDAQSSFDLGVAYREMGLVDQAVAQFKAAAAEPTLRARALVMLGSLRLQQGNAQEAISSLEEAVGLAVTSDETAEANYELGLVYEKIGDTGKAIARLSAVTEGYRDRDQRLGHLRG